MSKKEIVRTNLYRLQKQGLIIKDPKQKVFVLTPEGKRILLEIDNRILIFQKPWDGKLRLVFFDIPEIKKRWREWLRKELGLMGFQKIQESVYVGKYPLPQSFYKEISHQELDEYIFVITAGEIDKQEKILKVFEN